MILITGEVLQENIIIIKIDVYISEDEEKKNNGTWYDDLNINGNKKKRR